MSIRGGLAVGGSAIAIEIIVKNEEALRKLRETIQVGGEVKLVLGSTGEEAKKASADMMSFGQAVRIVNSMIIQLSISSFVTFMMLRRLRTTARSVRDAQEDVNEAIRKHGRFSKEARDAIQRYNDVTEEARFAQIEFAFQITLTSMGMITMATRIIPQLIPALATLKASLFGVAAAGTAAHIAIGPLGWALLGAGAVAVTVGGVYLAGGMGGGKEFDEQWTEAGSRVKREWLRQRR